MNAIIANTVPNSPCTLTCYLYTVDPLISEPHISDLSDYLNSLLMRFIGFLVLFK